VSTLALGVVMTVLGVSRVSLSEWRSRATVPVTSRGARMTGKGREEEEDEEEDEEGLELGLQHMQEKGSAR
jgi:hypothetical protein